MNASLRIASRCWLLILVVLGGCAPPDTPAYTVVPLSTAEAFPRRINAYYPNEHELQAVGHTRCPQHAGGCAYLWGRDDVAGVYSVNLAPGVESQALGVNDRLPHRDVVGWARIGTDQRPVLWQNKAPTGPPNLVQTTLSTIAAQGQAHDINNQLDVAGWCELADGRRHACRWVALGMPEDLGTLGGNNSEALAINNAGQIVGWSEDASGARHAFLWTPGGTDGVASNPQMRDIHTPFVATTKNERLIFATSIAVDLNEAGHVVGDLSGTDATHGFYWSREAGGHSLGESTSARGINTCDAIVGFSQISPTLKSARLWTSSREAIDLNEKIPVAEPHWHLASAEGINDHGDIVASAYVSNPPLPPKWSAVFLGINVTGSSPSPPCAGQ